MIYCNQRSYATNHSCNHKNRLRNRKIIIFSSILFEFQTTPSFENVDLEVYFIKQLELLQSEKEWESYGSLCIVALLISATIMRIYCTIRIFVIFSVIRFEFQITPSFNKIDLEVYFITPLELLQLEMEQEC